MKIRTMLPNASVPPALKRFTICIALLTLPAFAQQVTVDVTPGHSTNSFSPLRALGLGLIVIR
jgi:hypothetical protein